MVLKFGGCCTAAAATAAVAAAAATAATAVNLDPNHRYPSTSLAGQ